MIQTTNKTRKFIEEHKSDLYIYGAGAVGYWVGYYLEQCGIDYCGYLDREVCHEGALYNGKPLYRPDIKLCDYVDRDLRIIVATKDKYPEILRDLLCIDEKINTRCIVLTPYYKNPTLKRMQYDINRMLGYFRSKLFRGDLPTIICNTCLAGSIYDALGKPCISPTVNTFIHPSDYIKLCNNLHHYMEQEITMHWERAVLDPTKEVPTGIVDDIKIYFAHYESIEEAQKSWNNGKAFMNWERIIYLISDHPQNIPIKILKEFYRLKGEKLVVNRRGMMTEHESNGTVFYYQNRPQYLMLSDLVIESEFDLLGWINQEYFN